MTISGALTVIAICFAVLTLLVVGSGIVLMMIALRIIRLEKTITREISGIKDQLAELVHTAKESSNRLGHTVQEVKSSAYRVGLLATGIAGFLEARRNPKKAGKRKGSRPWWVSGIALGYSLWKKRQRSKQNQPPSSSASA